MVSKFFVWFRIRWYAPELYAALNRFMQLPVNQPPDRAEWRAAGMAEHIIGKIEGDF